MKKLLIILVWFICAVCNQATFAQAQSADTTNNYNEKADLPLLGKVWGFLKYHHPNVTKGQFNWDEQLIKVLPAYMAAKDKAARNQVLLKWVSGLGNVPTYPIADSIILNAKLNPDLAWINSNNFSPALLGILGNLKQNHSTADQKYIKYMADADVVFPIVINEDAYTAMKLPSYQYRLIAAFRYWNLIAYWYPYKSLARQNWDKYLTVLTHEALAVRTETDYVHFIQGMIASIKDTHAYVRSTSAETVIGKYKMPFTVKLIQNKAIVNSADPTMLQGKDLQKGYELQSVNGMPISTIVDNVKPYLSASNNAALLREAARYITRTSDSVSNLVLADSRNVKHNVTVKNLSVYKLLTPDLDFSYQKDSTYFMMKNNILYINVATTKRTQIPQVKILIKNAKGVIFDGRQYPKTGIPSDLLDDLMFAKAVPIAMFSTAIKGYPGVFTTTKPLMSGKDNPSYYKGKVVYLTNEETLSTGEFYAMFIRAMPNAVIVGSQTAGADGNVVSPFPLPGGIYTAFTGIGVFYPDGRQTQQIGIVPDVKVSQTIKGFREHRDELLDKAVEVILNGKK